MSVDKRREVVGNLGYCFNCLARSHTLNSCSSMGACKRCDQLHHTLLHPPRRQQRHQRNTTSTRSAPSHRSLPHQPRTRRYQPKQRNRQRQSQQPRRQQPSQPRRQQPSQHRRRQPSQHRYQQQQPHQPQQQQQHTQQPTREPQAKPDTQVLAEAIKSLANVLCVNSTPLSIG